MSGIGHKNCFQIFLAVSLAAHVLVFGILSGTHKKLELGLQTPTLEIQLLTGIVERKVATPWRQQDQVPVRQPATHAVIPTAEVPKLMSEAPRLLAKPAANPLGAPLVVSTLTANDGRRLDAYIQSLTELIGQQRTYPRLARMRGWEGTVTLRLQFVPGGRLHEVAMANSSGHDVLDQRALEMAQRLSSWPLPPDEWRERVITVLVPVEFRLQ